MTELICIVCPKGCHLKVDEQNDYAVTGNSCPRGAEYGRAELTNPTRVVTSTVKIEGALHPRCPVKTNAPIPKKFVMDAVRALNGICLHAPVTVGQVILKNVCGTGVDFIATRNFEKFY